MKRKLPINEVKSDHLSLMEKYRSLNRRESAIERLLTTDTVAREFFANYIRPNGHHLTQECQQRYSINADVLNALLELINIRSRLYRSLSVCPRPFWPILSTIVSELKNELGHSLPKSSRRLSKILSDYNRNGYKSLVNMNYK